MIPVLATAALVVIVTAMLTGHIAHPRRITATTPGTAAEDRAAIEEHDMPKPPPEPDFVRFPALAVACPECGSAPGVLCTSHSGTRYRRSDVHQARTAAYNAQRTAQ
ncbi:zinc finger domain-containing protein [Streptomyces sp. NPDC001515]